VWKWERLEREPAWGFADVVLKEPQEIHTLLESHSQYDGPIPMKAVKENI